MSVRYRTCGAYGNERQMPPRVIWHCGRHMQFFLGPLVYWCPMCGTFITVEEVERL